jgi:hypothetical protein
MQMAADFCSALKYAAASLQLVQDKDAREYVGRFRQALVDGKDVSGF